MVYFDSSIKRNGKNTMIKGDILKGSFSKTANRSWWDCEFLHFDSKGNFVVKTSKGVKSFRKDQYNPNAVQSKESLDSAIF